MSRTQKQIVLDLLIQRGETGVSAREAIYDLHITRLAAIVFDLKQDGYAIRSEQKKGETARYFLSKPEPKKQAIPCRACGHPAKHHVSGTQCIAEISNPLDPFAKPTYCQCQKYAEGEM